MKRLRVVVLAAILAFTKPATAQVFRIGPQAGRTVSVMTNDSAKIKQASMIGASYVLNMSEHLVVEGGLNYAQKGGDWKKTAEEVHQFSYSVKLHYAEAPVILSWFFNDDKKRFRPSIGAGITPAFLVKGVRLSQYNDLSNGYATDVMREDLNKKFNRWDVGATGTAGVNYKMKNRSWLSARIGYSVGQLPLYFEKGLEKISNRSAFIHASWQIPIGEYQERSYVFR